MPLANLLYILSDLFLCPFYHRPTVDGKAYKVARPIARPTGGGARSWACLGSDAGALWTMGNNYHSRGGGRGGGGWRYDKNRDPRELSPVQGVDMGARDLLWHIWGVGTADKLVVQLFCQAAAFDNLLQMLLGHVRCCGCFKAAAIWEAAVFSRAAAIWHAAAAWLAAVISRAAAAIWHPAAAWIDAVILPAAAVGQAAVWLAIWLLPPDYSCCRRPRCWICWLAAATWL